MAHIVADRVKETTTTTGTGNLTLAGAVTGFQAFSAVCANNDTFFYAIFSDGSAEYEVGLGTYVSATPAIARTTVIESSNSDNAVNFSAGTKTVIITSIAVTQSWGVLRVAPSGKQNDYNPTGLKYTNILELNPTESLGITGLAGGYEGRHVQIRNVTTDYLLWLENENTASSAANRFDLPNSFPAFLMPGDSITLRYNDTADRWEVSAWPMMGPAMGLTEFNDFVSGRGGQYFIVTNGTGASGQQGSYLSDTTERPNGIAQLDTGTTATGRATMGFESTDGFPCALGAALSVARLAVETTVTGTETFQIISGYADCAGGTFTDGVAWNNRWNGSAAEWSQDRLSNGTATRSTTGSPTPNNNYIWLVVFVNPGWTRADFIYSEDSIAFTRADSPTTGLPGNTRDSGWVAASIIKSAGTTQRNVSIDLAGHREDWVRG